MVGLVGSCCLLLFTSNLKGWGPTCVVGVDLFYFVESRFYTHNSTYAYVVHHFRVSFDAIISFIFVLCCSPFAVCK